MSEYLDLEKFAQTVDELGAATNLTTDQMILMIDRILDTAEKLKDEVDNTPLSDEEIQMARLALTEML